MCLHISLIIGLLLWSWDHSYRPWVVNLPVFSHSRSILLVVFYVLHQLVFSDILVLIFWKMQDIHPISEKTALAAKSQEQPCGKDFYVNFPLLEDSQSSPFEGTKNVMNLAAMTSEWEILYHQKYLFKAEFTFRNQTGLDLEGVLVVHSNTSDLTHLHRAIYMPKMEKGKEIIVRGWPVLRYGQQDYTQRTKKDRFTIKYYVKAPQQPVWKLFPRLFPQPPEQPAQTYFRKLSPKQTFKFLPKISLFEKSPMPHFSHPKCQIILARNEIYFRSQQITECFSVFSEDDSYYKQQAKQIQQKNTQVNNNNPFEKNYNNYQHLFLADIPLQAQPLYRNRQGSPYTAKLSTKINQILKYLTYASKDTLISRPRRSNLPPQQPQQEQVLPIQGDLNNCYMIAVIDQIITKGKFILDMLWAFYSPDTDRLCIFLNIDGCVQPILTKMRLPQRKSAQQSESQDQSMQSQLETEQKQNAKYLLQRLEYYKRISQSVSKPSEESLQTALNAIMIEKVIAKVFRKYKNLEAGYCEETFWMLTNRATAYHNLSQYKTYQPVMQLWELEQEKIDGENKGEFVGKNDYKKYFKRIHFITVEVLRRPKQKRQLQLQFQSPEQAWEIDIALNTTKYLSYYKYLRQQDAVLMARKVSKYYRLWQQKLEDHCYSFKGIYYRSKHPQQELFAIIKLRDPRGEQQEHEEWRKQWFEFNQFCDEGNYSFTDIYQRRIVCESGEFFISSIELLNMNGRVAICKYDLQSQYKFIPAIFAQKKPQEFTIKVDKKSQIQVSLHQRILRHDVNQYQKKKVQPITKYPTVLFQIATGEEKGYFFESKGKQTNVSSFSCELQLAQECQLRCSLKTYQSSLAYISLSSNSRDRIQSKRSQRAQTQNPIWYKNQQVKQRYLTKLIPEEFIEIKEMLFQANTYEIFLACNIHSGLTQRQKALFPQLVLHKYGKGRLPQQYGRKYVKCEAEIRLSDTKVKGKQPRPLECWVRVWLNPKIIDQFDNNLLVSYKLSVEIHEKKEITQQSWIQFLEKVYKKKH